MSDLLTSLARMRCALLRGARTHYELDDILEIRVPMLVDVTGACETVSNVLVVQDDDHTVLTQTGQLALEFALERVEGAWCHTGSFRGEVIDARHLREFELVEEEISCRHPVILHKARGVEAPALFEILLDRIAAVIKAMIRELLTSCSPEVAHVGGDLSRLAALLDDEFGRITYHDALEVIGRSPDDNWGYDFSRDDEELLLRELAPADGPVNPTFVTLFPEGLKFFNMKTDCRDPRTVLSVDLLLPGIGESVGGAVREDRFDVLRERFDRLMLPRLLERKGTTETSATEPFERYFNAVRAGRAAPHAGYGLGLERVMSYAANQPDIRLVSTSWILTANPHLEDAP